MVSMRQRIGSFRWFFWIPTKYILLRSISIFIITQIWQIHNIYYSFSRCALNEHINNSELDNSEKKIETWFHCLRELSTLHREVSVSVIRHVQQLKRRRRHLQKNFLCQQGWIQRGSGGSLQPPSWPPVLNILWKWNNLVWSQRDQIISFSLDI